MADLHNIVVYDGETARVKGCKKKKSTLNLSILQFGTDTHYYTPHVIFNSEVLCVCRAIQSDVFVITKHQEHALKNTQ